MEVNKMTNEELLFAYDHYDEQHHGEIRAEILRLMDRGRLEHGQGAQWPINLNSTQEKTLNNWAQDKKNLWGNAEARLFNLRIIAKTILTLAAPPEQLQGQFNGPVCQVEGGNQPHSPYCDSIGLGECDCGANSKPADPAQGQPWEVAPGEEADDWGIRIVGEIHGKSIAQMMWEHDAKEVVRLHNSAQPQMSAREFWEQWQQKENRDRYTIGDWIDDWPAKLVEDAWDAFARSRGGERQWLKRTKS